jgi:hypothetical protein
MKRIVGTLKMSRQLFIDTIEIIKEQYDIDSKCHEAGQVIFPDSFVGFYDNSRTNNQLCWLLQIAMCDIDKQNSWIQYFINDLEFGKAYKPGCCEWEDGRNIDLSNAGKLYDFLIENAKSKKKKK